MIKEEATCPVCGSKRTKFQKKFRNNHPCFSNLQRMACLECHLHFAHPMPKIEKLDDYNSSYHDSAHGGSKRDIKQQAFFTGLAKTRLAFIQENINLEKNYPYKILEIGPGPGAFVKVWMDTYEKSKYSVIESDKSCHQDLKRLGVKIIKNDFDPLQENYDIIIISHVLEHLTDPNEFLNPFIKQLKKGGHLFIEVPCMDWRHKEIDEPHLLFFDKRSMSVLLNKLKLTKLKLAYYGIPHKHLLSFYRNFFKRLRRYLWRKEITYFHPEKKHISTLVKNDIETQALLSFDAHKEQSEYSWWLRVISKK